MVLQHVVAVETGKMIATTRLPVEIGRIIVAIVIQAKIRSTEEIHTVKVVSPRQTDTIQIVEHITQVTTVQTNTTILQVGKGVKMNRIP